MNSHKHLEIIVVLLDLKEKRNPIIEKCDIGSIITYLGDVEVARIRKPLIPFGWHKDFHLLPNVHLVTIEEDLELGIKRKFYNRINLDGAKILRERSPSHFALSCLT